MVCSASACGHVKASGHRSFPTNLAFGTTCKRIVYVPIHYLITHLTSQVSFVHRHKKGTWLTAERRLGFTCFDLRESVAKVDFGWTKTDEIGTASGFYLLSQLCIVKNAGCLIWPAVHRITNVRQNRLSLSHELAWIITDSGSGWFCAKLLVPMAGLLLVALEPWLVDELFFCCTRSPLAEIDARPGSVFYTDL